MIARLASAGVMTGTTRSSVEVPRATAAQVSSGHTCPVNRRSQGGDCWLALRLLAVGCAAWAPGICLAVAPTILTLPDLDGRPRSAGGHRGMLLRWLCYFRAARRLGGSSAGYGKYRSLPSGSRTIITR